MSKRTVDAAEGERIPGGADADRGIDRDVERMASRFATLGEPKRLGILLSLGAGERCACDLVGCCGDRQPLLSFHLRRLREAGLVRARREGRWMRYSLNREELRSLAAALEAIAEGTVPDGTCC